MAYTQVTTSPLLIEFARQLGATGLHVGLLGAAPTGLFFIQFLAAVVTRNVPAGCLFTRDGACIPVSDRPKTRMRPC